jgi:hypothetical protein
VTRQTNEVIGHFSRCQNHLEVLFRAEDRPVARLLLTKENISTKRTHRNANAPSGIRNRDLSVKRDARHIEHNAVATMLWARILEIPGFNLDYDICYID